MNVYKIFNLTILTLHCKLPHAKQVKCNAFFSVRLWVALKKACFCGRVALKITVFLQQMFKMMPLRLHACTQSCYPLINGLVDEALRNTPVTL